MIAPPRPETRMPACVRYLARAGHSAPSADNSQPWRFVWDGKVLRLIYDVSRKRDGLLDRRHPAVQLAFGAVVENMVQAAAAAGIDASVWELGFPEGDDADPFLTIPWPVGECNAEQLPEWLKHRHTNRAKFVRTPLPDDVVTTLLAQSEGGVGTQVYREPQLIRGLAALVRNASEIRFQTEEIHRWLAQGLRFTTPEVDRGDGLDVEALHLPPGGRQLLRFVSDWRRMALLNKLHAYKLLALAEGLQVKKCGGIVAIVGSRSGDTSWITAGRLMERVWLFLNGTGLSVHPYFVLPDVLYRFRAHRVPDSLRDKAYRIAETVRAFPGFGDRTLFMLMRVGESRIATKSSRRLPLNDVLYCEHATRDELACGSPF